MISLILAMLAWPLFGLKIGAAVAFGGLVEILTHRCPRAEPSVISKADCQRMTVEGDR